MHDFAQKDSAFGLKTLQTLWSMQTLNVAPVFYLARLYYSRFFFIPTFRFAASAAIYYW